MDKTKAIISDALFNIKRPLFINNGGALADGPSTETMAIIPAVPLGSFGSQAFKDEYGLKFAYVGGAMVGGITSPAMVAALARGGALGMYGASGTVPANVEKVVAEIKADLGDLPFGSCLIHTPQDPSWEEKVTEIYLKHGVRVIEASAFMQLSLPLVRYRLSGARRNPDGTLFVPNRIMAKVSRVELAKRFFSPAPEKMVKEAVCRGWLTQAEADLAPFIPMAQDLTAEADSGGHTDFRPALALWPAMVQAVREFNEKHQYQNPIRVGVAGGIGTPWALLAAQAAGAAYVVTGSINQACVESGLSPLGRELLAKAGQADVAQSPAADMFELGAKVQVLKFGTLYAMRAQKLADAYKLYASMDDIPEAERQTIETQIFKQPLKDIWEQTRSFFEARDPEQLAKASKDPKYQMALVFRWYLGQASRWAIGGLEDRRADWQIFCGPAQGAFNEWAKGTMYEAPENRKVMDLALNLIYGAAVLKRYNTAKTFGALPADFALTLKPKAASEIEAFI